MNIGGTISGALFDEERRFRYALWRKWEIGGECLLFIGLNPSTAAHVQDDPTVRRLVGFAKTWGFSGLYVGNLFSLVSADPRLVVFTPPPMRNGPTDEAIKRMRELSTLVLAGWGTWGGKAGTRPAEVLTLVGEPVYCLKTTKGGEPSHPLYLPRESKLIRYYRKVSV